MIGTLAAMTKTLNRRIGHEESVGAASIFFVYDHTWPRSQNLDHLGIHGLPISQDGGVLGGFGAQDRHGHSHAPSGPHIL